jgi:hypothetical protein
VSAPADQNGKRPAARWSAGSTTAAVVQGADHGRPVALPPGAAALGAAPTAGSSAGSTPMTAAVDRQPDPAQPMFDVDALRRTLVADLMNLLRSDFERGA